MGTYPRQRETENQRYKDIEKQRWSEYEADIVIRWILYVEKALVKMSCLLDKMNTYSYSAPGYEFTRDREMKKMGIPQFKMDLYLYSFSLIFMGI